MCQICYVFLIDCYTLLVPWIVPEATRMILTLVLIFLLFTLLTYFILDVKNKQSYWKEKGIPYMKPTFFLGNNSIIPSKSFSEMILDYYRRFPETRYHGAYMFTTPLLVVKDLDLIKQILVKDFDHFTDRRQVVTNDIDPIWGRNLPSASGDRWRDLRSILSPTFTSSKMKMMYGLMEECALQFVEHFRNELQNEVMEIEAKDVVSRYTNDVIATTAFGLQCNSFKNKDNDFYALGKEVTSLNLKRLLRFMIFSIAPTLTKLLKIKVIPTHISSYFSKIIEDTIKTREEKHIVRPDMIHLLMEAKKGHELQDKEELKVTEGFSAVLESETNKNRTKPEITLEDIIAQAFVFFLAGFGTSTLLSFALYELSLHPDVQERLREEIRSVPEKITYEKLLGLKYLDAVVSETLRKWSPAAFTDRKVTKEFTIKPEKPGETEVTLEVGMHCLIPIWGIHRDEKYHPEPEKFDPERFSDENKHKILPFTFFPFGTGPRNCIGSRFALLDIKILLFHLLKNFEVVPVKRTPVPMVLDPKQFELIAKGGMWLGLKKIDH